VLAVGGKELQQHADELQLHINHDSVSYAASRSHITICCYYCTPQSVEAETRTAEQQQQLTLCMAQVEQHAFGSIVVAVSETRHNAAVATLQ
jgi:hypothetical protein